MKEQSCDIDSILEKYPSEPRYLISLLQDVQANYRYISEGNMRLVCDHVGVPITQAWSVATFYKAFSLEPRGEHEIKVCLGTACHLKGGQRLVDFLSRTLSVEPGQTTPDLKVTLDTVNCLGACAIAPVVVLDESYHAKMSAGKVDKMLKKLSDE
ncbi:MAG: NAD(P)H-dependent oxidoreductase subunit E [Pseudomonadota bacterium]